MLVFSGHDREYGVPSSLRASVGAERVAAWRLLDFARSEDCDLAAWANNLVDTVLASTSPKGICGGGCEDTGFYGIEDKSNPDIITALIRETTSGRFEILDAKGQWAPYSGPTELRVLDLETAEALHSVIVSGGAGLVLRYVDPVAWLPPTNAPDVLIAASAVDTTSNAWHEYAIVDDLDPGAVLNLVRLASGPRLEVYVNKDWEPDSALLADLQGVTPPMLVELDQMALDDVISQIDENSTVASSAFSEEQREKLTEQGVAMRDGSYPIRNRSDLRNAIQSYGRAKDKEAAKRHIIKRARALNAVATLPEGWGITAGVSPDPRAERLRRYWSIGGKGGLKIKWGVPGDWKRCVRYLSKYMGPRAKGYCQNMHKRNTGLWTGSKLNASAVSTWPSGTAESCLSEGIKAGEWTSDQGMVVDMQDGTYFEISEQDAKFGVLTAAGFPVSPPDEWFEDPKLDGPTPLTVTSDGRVSGHIATFDVAHIGMPGKVHAPKSRSNYSYFRTGDLVTASGKHVSVGQLTLAGGHAPLQADAGQAVAHYDNTASAVADLAVGEDRFGIWVAGAVRPETSDDQLRVLRASAPSGDWRPINGNLELVAICQVNVPGFPVARARVASGAVMALVAAGARPLAEAKAAFQADEALNARVQRVEAALIASGMFASEVDQVVSEFVEHEVDTVDTTVSEDRPVLEAPPVVNEKVAAIRSELKERRQQKRESLRARAHPAKTQVSLSASARESLRARVHGE